MPNNKTTPRPEEITRCSCCGRELASFDYLEGLDYARLEGMRETEDAEKVMHGTHYAVTEEGKVVVRVDSQLFTDIERRMI